MEAFQFTRPIPLKMAPLSYADETIRRIAIEVFGKEFLKKIKAYDWTSEEIMDSWRGK